MEDIQEMKLTKSNCGKTLEAVGEDLLKEAEDVYMTDELLSALSFVYGTPLLPALDLVDHRNVSCLTSPSGRSVYQVIGSSGTPYTCFTTSLYCSCPAYRYSVLLKDDHQMCKHLLAIKISQSMKLTKMTEVTDKEMTDLIKGID